MIQKDELQLTLLMQGLIFSHKRISGDQLHPHSAHIFSRFYLSSECSQEVTHTQKCFIIKFPVAQQQKVRTMKSHRERTRRKTMTPNLKILAPAQRKQCIILQNIVFLEKLKANFCWEIGLILCEYFSNADKNLYDHDCD